ncbi:MAG TPA: histidinol dehydrogenase [Bacillota bacterium]|nr:histidinol dehydrogenase [Bacillota bacterium]HOK69219.1 histidinol dehydrogenase [Bacillota bacterium]HPP84672.1 histidinol dehydrogenase [Bacillota bacterium]
MIRIYQCGELSVREMLKRSVADAEKLAEVEKTVDAIIADVRKRGDEALIDYTKKFDKVKLNHLKVTEREIEEAYRNVGGFLDILKEAAENIRAFHANQKRSGFEITKEGVVLGQKVMPLKRVGVYVPGGTASYPSTVLMNAIPAKIAGVEEIILVTPPDRNGRVPDAILAAAKIAGVNAVFKVGGAQAVAALAYGTESIPMVDKIVGPGNIYVATAKKKVFGQVAIDMIAGPSEILCIADSTADPRCVAADMLSQAEHDRLAAAVLICTDRDFAMQVSAELEKQISELPRADIARASIDHNGKIIVANSIDEAVEIANEIAPEHLELCVDNPFDYLDKIKNAGSIFLGKYTPEALGDYFAGPNHTLPTSGTARFSSPLSVDDFIKKSSYISYSKEALGRVKDKVTAFAEKEGLKAHARSVNARFSE